MSAIPQRKCFNMREDELTVGYARRHPVVLFFVIAFDS